jgi:pimeloyl-ACP methyl ester carboxylesterase
VVTPAGTVDVSLLREHASFISEGIEERAFFLEAPDGNCFALLSGSSDPGTLGFVVCHSYGLEFLTLRRLERTIARALAKLGYPVLSFHSRGYGDSSGSLEEVSLESHLDDLNAAIHWLRAETGISQIGLIGGGFGGLIAALAAREGHAKRLVLINPALRGASYLRQLLQRRLMVQLSSDDDTKRQTSKDLLARMRGDGYLDVLGHPIYLPFYEAVSKMDLASDMKAEGVAALVVHISKSSSIPSGIAAFGSQLEVHGGTCRVERVKEPPGTIFGGPAHVTDSDARARVNVQEPIEQEICGLINGWLSNDL